jgi:hypothetical protein
VPRDHDAKYCRFCRQRCNSSMRFARTFNAERTAARR